MTEKQKIYNMNTTNLAYIGDAVYEVYVRTHILKGHALSNTNAYQRESIKYVSAAGQAKIIKTIFEDLSEDEQKLVKRARNRKSATKPKNADPITYKWATAFEALLGYLFLANEKNRMEEIIAKAIEIILKEE